MYMYRVSICNDIHMYMYLYAVQSVFTMYIHIHTYMCVYLPYSGALAHSYTMRRHAKGWQRQPCAR